MVLVYVPAGEFTMGVDGGYEDEQPEHIVYLDEFWIDQTEVTNAMYTKCVAAGVCSYPRYSGSLTRSSYYGNPEYKDYPVIYVNWYQARDYCEWTERALPTEAQWEKAARGEDKRIYPWNDDNYGKKRGNTDWSIGDTDKVGSYPDGASPYGVLDMAGNVQEWVNDWYGDNYYSSSPYANPQGPASGNDKVMRGGSFPFYLYTDVRTANREFNATGNLYYNIGFRCAFSPDN